MLCMSLERQISTLRQARKGGARVARVGQRLGQGVRHRPAKDGPGQLSYLPLQPITSSLPSSSEFFSSKFKRRRLRASHPFPGALGRPYLSFSQPRSSRAGHVAVAASHFDFDFLPSNYSRFLAALSKRYVILAFYLARAAISSYPLMRPHISHVLDVDRSSYLRPERPRDFRPLQRKLSFGGNAEPVGSGKGPRPCPQRRSLSYIEFARTRGARGKLQFRWETLVAPGDAYYS